MILLTVTGHFGGSLTHGEDFLTKPLEEESKPIVIDINSVLAFGGFVEPIIKSAKIAAGWVGEYLKQNPEILWWIAGIAFALKFTPAGRAVSVLYAMVGKRWILALATSGIFAYLYSQLDTDTQKELQENKTSFKEVTGFDLDKLLQTHS